MLLALFCSFFVNLIKKSLTTRFGQDREIYPRQRGCAPCRVQSAVHCQADHGGRAALAGCACLHPHGRAFRSCRLRYRLRGVRNGQPPAAFPSRCIRVSESSVQPCRSPNKDRPPAAFGMDAAIPDDFPLFTVQIFDPVGIVATTGMLGAGAK